MTNYNALGTKLYRGGTAGTAIAQVTNIGGPGLKLETLEVTSHDSGVWREFIGGLRDGGEIKLDINYDPAGATHKDAAGGLLADLKNGTANAYALRFSDAATTTWTFNALVTSFEPKAPMDGKLSASTNLKITGTATLA